MSALKYPELVSDAMKKILIALVATMSIGAMTSATSSVADARRLMVHRHWGYNFWGYGSLTRGGWGLGGPADRTYVGGSIVAVTPYGPYPYGPFGHGLYP